mmetsp:Transcript_24326/g.72364  ORF Transcript_24326/g.72364 Transcript_24326/m.72364 type:complete len:725 (+) Transcript_24326:329-2503(+)
MLTSAGSRADVGDAAQPPDDGGEDAAPDAVVERAPSGDPGTARASPALTGEALTGSVGSPGTPGSQRAGSGSCSSFTRLRRQSCSAAAGPEPSSSLTGGALGCLPWASPPVAAGGSPPGPFMAWQSAWTASAVRDALSSALTCKDSLLQAAPPAAAFARVAANLVRRRSATFCEVRCASIALLAWTAVRYLLPAGSTNSRKSFFFRRKTSVRQPGGSNRGASLGFSSASAPLPLSLTPNSWTLLSPSLSLSSLTRLQQYFSSTTRSTALLRSSSSAGTNSRDFCASSRSVCSSAVSQERCSFSAASSTLPARCSSTIACTRGSRRQCGSFSTTAGTFVSSLGCSPFVANRWPGRALPRRLARVSSSSGLSGGAEPDQAATGACEAEPFSSAFTATAALLPASCGVATGCARGPAPATAPGFPLTGDALGDPLGDPLGDALGDACGPPFRAFFLTLRPSFLNRGCAALRCCFSRTDLASSRSPSCSRKLVTWLTSSATFSPPATAAAMPQASTRAFKASRSWIPRLSSRRRSRRAPDSMTFASSCLRCARNAQAPRVERIQRGRPATCSTVVTVCSSLGRPACPCIRSARPTDCTKALGVAGTSTRCMRRTAKKLTPSEQVTESATITRNCSPRRLLGALKAASSSIVATAKGGSLAAATSRRWARSASRPELRATSTSAFSLLAATAWATAWSLGAQAAMFARMRALLPLLPSCRLPKCTQRLQ